MSYIRIEGGNLVGTQAAANKGRVLDAGVGLFGDEYSENLPWLEGGLVTKLGEECLHLRAKQTK
jgi:hypothetical protein